MFFQGPHIASVTLAAYECNSVNFPEPPYPDQIICPDEELSSGSISLWAIISKVRLEACMWVRLALIYTPDFSVQQRSAIAYCSQVMMS